LLRYSIRNLRKVGREKGTKGFFTPRATRGAAVLVESVVAQVEELFAGGASVAEVATTLGLKRNTLEKAIRAGRIRAPVKKNSPTVQR
jgi:DNA invertase Pin-like site-specific DNA recombinase